LGCCHCQVIEGYDDVVKAIEGVGSQAGPTSKEVKITECGEIPLAEFAGK